MTDLKSLDEVRQELAAIHEELLTLPSDDFSRRVELQERRNVLRARSSQLTADIPESTRSVLESAFARLTVERDRILAQQLAPVSEAIGDAGLSSAFTRAINDAMARGLGLDEIETRLAETIDQLRLHSE